MTEAPKQEESHFVATFRLKPERSFANLRARSIPEDGYEFHFHDDMVWVTFDATSDDWLLRLDVGRQALRTLLAILAIQTEYPFDMEPIQWIEDKPRDQHGGANYVLGRLEPDLKVQIQPPSINVLDLQKGEIHAHLASSNPYYRYALLDYSVALSFPRESIVFCARSVGWVERYFDAVKRAPKKHVRTLMSDELSLPKKFVTQFFTIANQTVVARHAGAPRPPKIEEIRFCVFFSRIVLDRFGAYIWYSRSESLPQPWRYPENDRSPSELFEAKNPSLSDSLRQILTGKLS